MSDVSSGNVMGCNISNMWDYMYSYSGLTLKQSRILLDSTKVH